MKNILKLTAILLILAGSFACKDDDKFNTVDTSDFVLSSGCVWSVHFTTDAIPHDALFVINSEEELIEILYCEGEIPIIDFDKYSLIVFICDYGGKIIYNKLEQVDEYQYKWNIDINIKEETLGSRLNLSVLVPKLRTDTEVILNINKI
ncbi:MAG: hypothetical protein LBQ28_01795 [Prevotellaceae bacterium]|jgi:hypothetical protein|nr:hypothetical protein [Prevotellaceae bacterium]